MSETPVAATSGTSRAEPAAADWSAVVLSDDRQTRERWRNVVERLALASRVEARPATAAPGAGASGCRLLLVDLDREAQDAVPADLAISWFEPSLVIGFARTAERAVDAFAIRCHGFYLGQPEPESLRACLSSAAGRRLAATRGRATGYQAQGPSRILLRSRGRLLLVRPGEIEWIVSDRNYVVLQTPSGAQRVRGTLARWAAFLDRRRFVRIDRSTIVQLDRLQGLERDRQGRCLLRFSGGRRLPASPVHLEAVLARLLSRKQVAASAGRPRRVDRDTLRG